MKKCPFYAEDIQDEAIKCRFCGEFLSGQEPDEDTTPCEDCKAPIPYGKDCCPTCGILQDKLATHCQDCNATIPTGKDFCPACGMLNVRNETRNSGLPSSGKTENSLSHLKKWFRPWKIAVLIMLAVGIFIYVFVIGTTKPHTNLSITSKEVTQQFPQKVNVAPAPVSCDVSAAVKVQSMLKDTGCSWVDTTNTVKFIWGSDWDYINAEQRLALITTFANSDACLSGKARDIKFYRKGVLVGEASSSGIRLK